MNADSKHRARYAFVSMVVLCGLGVTGLALLHMIGSALRGWGDGTEEYTARPIADFVGIVSPILTLVLAAAAFYPGLSKRSYRGLVGLAFTCYVAFLATLLPRDSATAGIGFLFGIVALVGGLTALKSLREPNA